MNQAVELIPVQSSEKSAFMAMAVAHFQELDRGFTPLPEWESNYFETIQARPSYFLDWIVGPGKQRIGFILFAIEDHRFFPRKIGMIHELYVNPDWRRRKIAQTAAQRAIEHLHALGVQRVQLEVVEGNHKATDLWIKLGFHKVTARYVLPLKTA